MENRQLVLNSAKCLSCDETLISHHRHDFVSCNCGNLFIDGGTSYLRWGAKDSSKIEFFSVYVDEPFEKVRQFAERGSRGIDGDEPLTWVKLCDMSDDHLEAVLDYGGAEWHLDLIRKEIEFRKNG